MIVEISRADPVSGVVKRLRMLDLFAATDDSACELAYLLTKEDSTSRILDPSIPEPGVGDIFTVISCPDDLDRVYTLSGFDLKGRPEFSLIG